MRRSLLLALLLAPTGCALNSLESFSEDSARNQCTPDTVVEDCGEGAACNGGVCVAPQGDIDTVLFAITPPASGGPIAGVRFLKTVAGLREPSNSLLLGLEQPAHVTGWIDGALPDGCEPQVQATFTPSDELLGLPATDYLTKSVSKCAGVACAGFDVSLPAGDYDIYVYPAANDPTASVPPCWPPMLLRRTAIESGDVAFAIPAPVAQKLTVDVVWPPVDPLNKSSPPESLVGWSIDLLDRLSGHPVSRPVVLKDEGTAGDNGLYAADPGHYKAQVDYTQVVETDYTSGEEVVRLRPPPELETAPTLHWLREGLEVGSIQGETKVKPDPLPAPITVAGWVESPSKAHEQASLSFTAKAIDGIVGSFARHTVSVDTLADGSFAVQLLPGSYRVEAVPQSGVGLGAKHEEWTLGAEGYQAGRVVQLEDSATLSGVVSAGTPAGSPIGGAAVLAAATPSSVDVDPVARLTGNVPFLPRAENGATGDDGSFEIGTDPGEFDVSVQPPEGSGFPWLVRPNVTVAVPGVGLGPLAVSLPILHRGKVELSHAGIVSGALIRAYVFVDASGPVADPKAAQSVVGVAETRAGDDGSFTLLLPSKLSP